MGKILKYKLLVLVTSLFLQACSDTSTTQNSVQSDTIDDEIPAAVLCDSDVIISEFSPVTAIAATTSPTFVTGAHAIITGDGNGQFVSLNDLNPVSGADVTVVTYGNYFYVIGQQFSGNSITKYAIDNPQDVIWQYSVNEPAATVASNPHDMIFVSETKAYVLRYNKTKAWIVNPSATNEASFKIGELDLSAYATADGLPEMDAGLIVDGKLYILLQRLEGVAQQVIHDAYIAVFDTNTDTEIDVNITGDAFKGIPLTFRNPTANTYVSENNKLYVQSSGSFFPVEYVGGIEVIDLNDYSSTIILDDGDDASHPYGLITELAVISPERLYFVGYESFDVNTLYVMNTQTDEISAMNVPQLIDGQIANLAIDPQGLLWVSDNANATVRILNPLSCEEIDAVSTNLNPAKIVFAQ